jgi:hypothetical protein
MKGKGVQWAVAVDKDCFVTGAIRATSEGDWKPHKTEDEIAKDRETSGGTEPLIPGLRPAGGLSFFV